MTWIQTSSGGKLDFVAPRQMTFWDIACGLGNVCRYAGQIKGGRYYSVAEHSVHVMSVIAGRPEHAANPAAMRAALMHDAAEAYCGDVTRPLKQMLPCYKMVERRLDAAIRAQFGIGHEFDGIVKWADNAVLRAEKGQVQTLHPHPDDIDPPGDVADIRVRFLPPDIAREWFLSAWRALETMA
jgi:hypothetical protein